MAKENSLQESADYTVENCSFSASFPIKMTKWKRKRSLRQSHDTMQVETQSERKLGFGTHSMRNFRTRTSGEDWSSTKYGKSSAANEGWTASKMSLTCLREESLTAKSPWLLAAARRASAWSREAPAMSCPGIQFEVLGFWN